MKRVDSVKLEKQFEINMRETEKGGGGKEGEKRHPPKNDVFPRLPIQHESDERGVYCARTGGESAKMPERATKKKTYYKRRKNNW